MRHFRRTKRKKVEAVNSSRGPVSTSPPTESKAVRNVVSALHEHFEKWHPEVVTHTNNDGSVSLEVQDAGEV